MKMKKDRLLSSASHHRNFDKTAVTLGYTLSYRTAHAHGKCLKMYLMQIHPIISNMLSESGQLGSTTIFFIAKRVTMTIDPGLPKQMDPSHAGTNPTFRKLCQNRSIGQRDARTEASNVEGAIVSMRRLV